MATHEFHAHTGEVQMRVEGATLEEVFVEAARALAELIGTPTDDLPRDWQDVTVDARDPETLLHGEVTILGRDRRSSVTSHM